MLRGFLSQTLSLEQFIGDALQWPATDMKGFSAQWKYRDVLKMLPKHRSQVENALNTLDVRKHSLAYSYLLGYKSSEKMDDAQSLQLFVQQVSRLVNSADPQQISVFPRPMSDALREYVAIMRMNRRKDITMIPMMKQAVAVLQGGTANILTYAHTVLMECCVQSRCYHLASPEIEQDIVQVQGQGAIRSADNLAFHYYSGLVHIGTKQFARALESLTMVLTAPSESVSLIQMEAYKKYVLVSLIHKQVLIPVPRYTPKILTRYFPKFCAEYLEIAENFNRGLEVMGKLVEKNAEVYTKDYNFGLVRQTLKSLEKNAVIKLTSVYTRLSLEKVAELCKFESVAKARRILISMIQNGKLAATIDAEGVVKFEETVSESDAQMLASMQGRIQSLLELWNGLDKAQLEIKKSPQYIKKTMTMASAGMEPDMQQQMLLDSMIGGGANFFRT